MEADYRPVPQQETEISQSEMAFGHYFPREQITNEDMESWGVRTGSGGLLTAEDIARKVGVLTRYVARDDETPITMGAAAAHEAIIKGGKPDVVLVTTSFPQRVNVSEAIGKTLGLPPTEHLDIHAACSGFVMGLNYLHEHEEEFDGARVLFVATEQYQPYVHNLQDGTGEDPALSQTIFSDGAVAVNFVFGKDLEVVSGRNVPMFQHADLIGMPIDYDGVRQPALTVPIPYTQEIYQNGRAVFQTMVANIPREIEAEIQKSGVDRKGIKGILSHQGSVSLIEAAAKRLPGLEVALNYQEGNFSSASVPKIMMDMQQEGKLQKGEYVMDGFGAGLFMSKAVVRLK